MIGVGCFDFLKLRVLRHPLFDPVLARGGLVLGFEELVEVAEVFEAALLGDLDDFLLGGFQLHGGPLEAGAVDDLAGRCIQQAPTVPADVFMAAAGDADELRDAADEVRPDLDRAEGVGEPLGHGRVGCRFAVAVVEQREHTMEVGGGVGGVPATGSEVVAHLTESFAVFNAELVFASIDRLVVKEADFIGEERGADFFQKCGGEGEID